MSAAYPGERTTSRNERHRATDPSLEDPPSGADKDHGLVGERRKYQTQSNERSEISNESSTQDALAKICLIESGVHMTAYTTARDIVDSATTQSHHAQELYPS
jgi:hypothetical protein